MRKILYFESRYMQLRKWEYLASISDDSWIMCDETIAAEAKSYDQETKTFRTNFDE